MSARISWAPHPCDAPGDHRRADTLALRYGQADVSGLGGWQHLAVTTLSLLMVISLALSWMGPMLDHHFAERHPGHQHIYLGVANPEHSHEYRPFHSHNGLRALLKAAGHAPANAPDGIVFVVPASGSAHSVADITIPANAQSIGLGVAGGSGLLGHHLRQDTIPPGASITPPTLPPRA